jgi:hypothetical protein
MTHDQHAELQAMMPQLREAVCAPAGQAGVTAIVGRRFALFPQPDRSDGEWAAWWADYHAALEDLPAEAIEADVEFLPKPGKLRELARSSPTKSAGIYERARWLLAPPCSPREPLPEPPQPTQEQRDAVRRMAKDCIAALTKPPEFRIPATPPAKTDERGLTEAMRAHLAQRPRMAAE